MMRYFAAVARIVTAGVLMAFAGGAAAQLVYPSKPIRLIVPYPPGGSTDPMARMAAQKLSEGWGQPVIVENRPGGNTVIGTDAVAKAPPDGYTILFMGTPHVIGVSLLTTPYDAIKDFAPVATIAKSRFVLVLNPSLPANNLQEFIALARSRPGQLNYATSAIGSSQHLMGELFNILAGVKMQHIPYKGSGPVIADLIGGQVQLSFQVPISAIPHIKSGKLKAIAITGETRSSALPEVPTFAEAGLPGYEMAGWFGIIAPAGTPGAVIDKLSTETARFLAEPNSKEKLVSQGMEPFISTPEQFAALMKADLAKYAKIIKAANIKMEN